MKVQYKCIACGAEFTITQGDSEPDEDITYCWECTDIIVTDESHGSLEDPWTPELIRKARKN